MDEKNERMRKRQISIYLTDEGRELLDRYAEGLGISRNNALEVMIRICTKSSLIATEAIQEFSERRDEEGQGEGP